MWTRTITFAVALLFLVGLAVFVWPTAYRYDVVRKASLQYPIRTNRFTGKSAFFDVRLNRWSDSPATAPTARACYSPDNPFAADSLKCK